MVIKRPAIFLDRDGTIIEEVNYLSRPEQVRILPGVPETLKKFRKMEYCLVITTNQSGLARGYFNEKDLRVIHERIAHVLAQQGAEYDALYFCPHHIDGIRPEYKIKCSCRKPLPGMWYTAERDLCIDLPSSWSIGDKLSDLQAGHTAGTKVLMVETGYGREERVKLTKGWDSVPDMTAALEYIIHYLEKNQSGGALSP